MRIAQFIFNHERYAKKTEKDNKHYTVNQSEKYIQALTTVLQNAPVSVKDAATKSTHHKLVMKTLAAIKPPKIDEILSQLSQDDLEMLMKYIYRGFEQPCEVTQSNLLAWHEKVYKIGGNGCIVRVLTDRKRV